MTKQALTFAAVLCLILAIVNGSLIMSYFQTGATPLKRWVFLLYVVSGFDWIAAGLAAGHAFRIRGKNRLVLYYSMMLLGVAAAKTCALIGNLYPPKVTDYGMWYACWYWSGQYAETYGLWLLVLYQMGVINGHKD